MTRPPSPTRERIHSVYGGSTRIVEDSEPPADLACGSRENCEPLRGGLHLIFYNSQMSSNCSSGFVAVRNGTKQVLSAGHCTGAQAGHFAANSANPPFGTVQQSADSQRVDALRAAVTTSGIGARGWVFQNQDYQGRQVSGITSYGSLMVGTPVGKSGYQSGMTWGAITSKYLAPPGYQDLISADVSAIAGDSGSSLTKQANWAAVAVLKGVILSANPPELEGDTIYSHVQFVQSRLGVEIVVNDSP